MQVTYKKPKKESELSKYRKENAFYKQISVIVPENNEDYPNIFFRELIIVRFYTTESRCYCCVWIGSGHTDFYHGGAYAAGWGYHRGSAALESALNAAGFTLSEHISGRGEKAMNDALLALAKFLGYNKAQILEAHP